MDEHKLVEMLTEMVWESQAEYMSDDVKDIRSFQEAGLLTNNTGVVFYMSDGSRFELIVKKF